MIALARGRPDGPLSPLGLGIALGVVALDQGAKWLADTTLPFGQAIDILPFLALYLTVNSGIAFSLFAGFGTLGLIAATSAISLAVAIIWARSREGGRLAAIGYALILGGAIGNLIDRVLRGVVVDYLLLHAGGWTLFVFNLADAALTLGPIALVLAFMQKPEAGKEG
ncbi:MAG: signal peptidase II [Bauldia sp.]